MTSTDQSPALPLRVLFVCTANISRSPYAERRAADLLPGHDVTVASAGVPGLPGREMDPEMAAQLRAHGGDPEGHVSRSLTGDLLAQVDLVLTFEFAQRMRVLDAWPQHAAKVFGLHQFTDALALVSPGVTGKALETEVARVSAPDSMTWDVADPYRRGRRVAGKCADEIDVALDLLVPALTAQPPA